MMKAKLTIAGIGALLIMVAIYFFPFGQDIVILWMTQYFGSQEMAWTVMYLICFGLLGAGILMGGMGALRLRRITGLLKMLVRNPIMFIALLVSMFLIFQYITTII